jgi:hypothetical protein
MVSGTRKRLRTRFYEAAQRVWPNVAIWPRLLGLRYLSASSAATDAESRRSLGRAAFQELERAVELEVAKRPDSNAQPNMSPLLASSALAAGDREAARRYAIAAVSPNPALERLSARMDRRVDGEHVFTGHTVLGLLAVDEGDVATAKTHLLAAASTTGTPSLNSAGPDMELADELLALGEIEAVSEYLNKCRRFWHKGSQLIDRWLSEIGRGDRPNLTADLWRWRLRGGR